MNDREFDDLVREVEHPILAPILRVLDKVTVWGAIILLIAWLLN